MTPDVCRFVDAVEREKEQGVPLQHLAEIVSVQGFDIDAWVRPEVVRNEVCRPCFCSQLTNMHVNATPVSPSSIPLGDMCDLAS